MRSSYRTPDRELVVPAVGLGAVLGLSLVSVLGFYLDTPSRGVLVGFVCACIGGLLAYGVSGRVIRPVSFYSLFFLAHFVLFVARPGYAVVYQEGRNLFTGQTYDGSYLTAQYVAGAAFISFSLVYGAVSRHLNSDGGVPGLRPVTGDSWPRLRSLLRLVAVAGIGLYLIHIAQIGVGFYLSSALQGRGGDTVAATSVSSGYFYSGLGFATGALLLLLFQHHALGDRRGVVVTGALLLALAVPSLLTGTRSQFLPVAISLFVLWSQSQTAGQSWRKVVLYGPVALVVGFVAPRIWRETLSSGGTIGGAIKSAVDPQQVFGQSLGSLDTAMVDAFAIQVSAQDSGQLEAAQGSSYLGLLAAPVPRGVWAGKPAPTDGILNSFLFPETAERGIGFSFSAYSEPYYNFGIIGAILVFAILGAAAGKVSASVHNGGTVVNVFVYAMIAGYVFALTRGTFSYNFQRVLIPMAPALICVLLSGYFSSRSRDPVSSGESTVNRAIRK